MSTTKRKTGLGYVEPETPQGTEGVVVTPTFTDIVTSGGASASPARVGNRQYANNTGSEVVPGGGEGTIVESGGGTTASPTPMTYEEWYNRTLNRINQDAQTAKDLANIGYEKSKSEYGSKAAALESMGLTGSGYSDYLNSQAYAQMQSAYANADAQRAQSMLDLDTKYMDILDQQKREEEQKAATLNSNFVTTMGSITADTTDTEIDQIGAAFGYSPEQIASLRTQRDTLVTKRTEDEAKAAKDKQQSAYQTVLGMINYGMADETIDTLAAAHEITDETLIKSLKDARVSLANDYMRSLDPEEISVQMLDHLFPGGPTPEGQEGTTASNLYKQYYEQIEKSVKDKVYPGMFEGEDRSTALAVKDSFKAMLEKQEAAASENDKAAYSNAIKTLEDEYNKTFNSGSSTTKLYYMPSATITKGKGDGAYKNIVVSYGDVNYKIQYRDGWNQAATDAAKNANVQDGEVFAHDNVLYVWEDGKAMTLEPREEKRHQADYKDLLDRFKNDVRAEEKAKETT